MSRIQIAFATDTRMFEPTLVAMMSAIESTRRPVTVHFLGHGLDDAARRRLDRAVGCWPQADLVFHDMVAALNDIWEKFAWNGRHTAMTKALLHIPALVEGKVLYLDSDTLTYADVGALFDTDMQDRLIGAVRDYGYLVTWSELLPLPGASPNLLEREAMAPHPVSDYINTGVVLFDCDAINAEPGLARALSDPDGLTCDTKRMVGKVKGRILHLDPSWNVSRGIHNRYARAHAAMLPYEAPYAHVPAKILHHVGIEKPWHDFDLDLMRRDISAARNDLFAKLDMAAHGRKRDIIFWEVKDELCLEEYVGAVRTYRASFDRYMSMLRE